ncbi:assimilatory nitrite reductase (NAD(P)H) large subunit precursor [Neobacillus bataviensis]|uniref:Assimilatory nitrite reductase (NAD(P)H) large subunit n=1 Tax=Neobacillus bataviensis TaxID=220685 RepID=A0A561CWU6_9BACI|nr:nitrite reductase large subunit NirB [Neobacillus bataviensis]TWD95666.1 assimilatory nitrite reductase (NAD(P)H) large subunit precursor [Neobacillus bataviensis]
MKKLVMIGNGMAGVRTIEEILKLNTEQFDFTIFGEEPHPNYNRIKLSNILQGDTNFDDIIINPLEWYKENNIQLYTGEAIVTIDVESKRVISDQGREVEYDELIIATGSNSFILPIPGADKIGVTGFRDIKDCEMMIKSAGRYQKAAVIGGGLLGLEAARGLLNLGMKVDVVHLMPHLMERQLDPIASSLLKTELESQGMNFLMKKQTVEILGDERVTGLRFKDGSEVEADLVVMAIGIKSNIQVAKDSGIYVNRGIVVNDYMETSVPHVYAVGECAEHREIVYGLVAPLYEQGKILASHICGIESKPYEGSVTGTQLKVAGVDLFSAGEIFEDGTTKSIMVYNEYEGLYKRVLTRNNTIVGIVLYGDTKDSTRLYRMLTKKEDISGVSIFHTECTGEGSTDDIASMSNDELVCGCNGVTKGAIVEAIHTQGLTTLDQVSHCTNAGRSCGRCKPMVSQILAHTLGDQFDAAAAQKTSICGCTTVSREELVAEIKEKGLTSVKEVMNVLDWNNTEGCTKCRPAINYYLGMIHMDEYKDDRDSRLVNEKMHANIQKDGTYSVVPRMYGGVTTAADLKKIAEVAEKYNVPLVKLTGGQRIGLFGVKKEDLPAMWEELDMPSGYAYGKTLRTVKTCVGAQFCRYGTQDSMTLGIKLEKKFERLDTPHKVKMGVSACPRNCSEAGIKDIGFVGIDGGWEIYVAGNGGVDLRAGDLLCTVKTEEEVMEITSAYLQYYRETANYLERTSKWVERMGLDHVKEVLADEETRRGLNDRMDQTLKKYIEPWNEAIQNEEIKDKYYTRHNISVGSESK